MRWISKWERDFKKRGGACFRLCYSAFRALVISGSEGFFLVSFRVLRCKARDGHSAKEKGQAIFAVERNFLFFLPFFVPRYYVSYKEVSFPIV